MTMSRRIALAAVLSVAGLLSQASPAAAMIAMSWSLESRVDPATGDKSCLITSLGGDITARLSLDSQAKTMTWSVMIGFGNQPGSVRYLRIDGEVFQNAEASFQGDVADDIVARLIFAGADVNIAARDGWTALKAADMVGDDAIVRMLRDAGARR